MARGRRPGATQNRKLTVMLQVVLACALLPALGDRAFAAWPIADGEEEAQPVPLLPEDATLSDALALAALNNRGLEAAFQRWKAALEREPQVTALPDPQFTYRYFIERVETRVGPQRQAFGLAQRFPWFGTLGLRGEMASEAARAAYQEYQAEKLRLFHEVKAAWVEYVLWGRTLSLLREERELIRHIENVARAQYRVGSAQHSDVIRAQVEMGRIEDRTRSLEALREPILARLNAALNRPSDAPLDPAGELPSEVLVQSDEQIMQRLAESSPALRALDHETKRREYAVALARKQYWPDVTLGVEYIDTGNARGMAPRRSGRDPIIARVGINLPIWWQKYGAGVREAGARRRAAARTLEEKENALEAEVSMTLYELHDAARRIDLYRDTLIPKAREALKVTESGYRAGTSSFLDLLDAERSLLEFKLAYEEALARHAERLAALEMLVGAPLGIPAEQFGIRSGDDTEAVEQAEDAP